MMKTPSEKFLHNLEQKLIRLVGHLPTRKELQAIDLEFKGIFRSKQVRGVFKRNLTLLLALADLNYTDLGKKVGVDPSHIIRIRDGNTNPSFLVASSIAQGLNVQMNTLFLIDIAAELRRLIKNIEQQ